VSGLSIDHSQSGRRRLFRAAASIKRIARFAVVIKRTARFAVVIFGGLAVGASAEVDPAQAVRALAERGLAHIRDVGREQALADFSRPDGGFIEGDHYIFCLDAGGVLLASGGSPKIIGHNLADARGSDGRLATVEVVQLGLSRGSGWLKYNWPNPATRRIELKATYVLKVDDNTVCGSGYYEKGTPP
jgi:cytochrome c